MDPSIRIGFTQKRREELFGEAWRLAVANQRLSPPRQDRRKDHQDEDVDPKECQIGNLKEREANFCDNERGDDSNHVFEGKKPDALGLAHGVVVGDDGSLEDAVEGEHGVVDAQRSDKVEAVPEASRSGSFRCTGPPPEKGRQHRKGVEASAEADQVLSFGGGGTATICRIAAAAPFRAVPVQEVGPGNVVCRVDDRKDGRANAKDSHGQLVGPQKAVDVEHAKDVGHQGSSQAGDSQSDERPHGHAPAVRLEKAF